MTDQKRLLDELIEFKNREKFSASAWLARGLNPSDSNMCSWLEREFNACTDSLIEAVKSGNRPKQYKTILRSSLSHFHVRQLDTEEREFVCDTFFVISEILSIDFKGDLTRWLYGSTLGTFLRISAFIRGPEKVASTLTQDCTGCGSKLETFIIKREKGIPDHDWMIVQCAKCGEYNLISPGPDISGLRFGKYKLAEQLGKAEFTEDQAKVRLEQIRFFRKR